MVKLGTALPVALAFGGALTLAQPARAEPLSGGSGAVRIKGESEPYRVASPKAPLVLQLRGAGDLSLKIRGLLPQGPMPSEGVKVRIVEGGTERTHLSLSIYAAGSLVNRTDLVPTGPSSRAFKLGEGNHNITVEAKGGSAAVLIHWKAKHHRGHPELLDDKPELELAAAPLASGSASTPAPEAQPSASASPPPVAVGVSATPAAAPAAAPALPPPPPVAEVPPATAAAQPASAAGPPPSAVPPAAPSALTLTPLPSATVAAEPPPERGGRSPLPFVLAGAAALCAAGSGVSVGLAVGQYSTYGSSPETQGGASTNRPGMLNTANGELAAAEILGAAAAALLVATGVSLFF